MSRHEHGVCVGAVALAFLCNVGLAMENNDSRLVRVPRSEFVRVMGDIVSGGAAATAAAATASEGGSRGSVGGAAREILLERSRGAAVFGDNDEDEEEGYYPLQGGAPSSAAGEVQESPRSTATRHAQQASAKLQSRRRAKHVKSDSLYFLQRGIEEREARVKAAIQQQYSSGGGGDLPNPVSRRFPGRHNDSVSSGADDGSFAGYGNT